MKLNLEEAYRVIEHGTRYVSNQRRYIRHGGVSYPVASLTWCINHGEWPKSTPRHIDGNPANNDISNLRPPGRTKKPRKSARETMVAAPMQPAQVDSPVMAYLTKAISDNAAQVRSLFDPA